MNEHTYIIIQIVVIVSAIINISLILIYRNCVGDYRKAITTPIFHWLVHIVIFYTTWLIFHETSELLRSIHVYWSSVLRLHGMIAIGTTFLGMIGREGIWKQLLQKIPRLRSWLS
jgi:hypothetical protein